MKLKTLLAVGLTAVSAAALTGCGGSGTNSGAPEYGFNHTNPEDVVAEIEFWHVMSQSSQTLLNQMIANFNKIYPNIKVTHAAQGGWADINGKVNTALQGASYPNLTFAYPDHVASYLTQQKVVDLDSFINSGNSAYRITEEEQEDFEASSWNAGKVYNSLGTMFSFPYANSSEVLFYNATLFEQNNWEVPTTWDEMWALCADMKETYPDKTPLAYDSENNMVITLLEQHGYPYTSVTGGEKYLFNNDKTVSLFEDIQEYYKKGFFTSSGMNDDNYSSTQFKSQEFIMTIGSTGGASHNQPGTDSLGKPDFEYGVSVMPQVDLNNRKAIAQGPSICILDKTQAENEAAWLFLQYITNTDNSAIYAAANGYSPVRSSSTKTDLFISFLSREDDIKADANKVYLQQQDAHFTSAAFNGSTAAREEMGFFLENICLKPVSVADALQEAYDNLTK